MPRHNSQYNSTFTQCRSLDFPHFYVIVYCYQWWCTRIKTFRKFRHSLILCRNNSLPLHLIKLLWQLSNVDCFRYPGF
jgi:hypothetical protein